MACHTVAATTAARRSALADRLVGDGLVPLRSALGEHGDPRFVLRFAPASRFIAWRTGHLALLRSPEVARQVLRWLGVSAADARTLVADERDGFYALEHARSMRRARRNTRQEDAATGTPVAALAE